LPSGKKPDTHWLGNRQTIWTHLLVRHEMEAQKADEALRLYCAGDADSEMDYTI
jgi:hypothetical protein